MRAIFVSILIVFTLCGCGHPSIQREDLESLAGSGPLNNSRLATDICGQPATMMGGPDPKNPLTALPRAKLLTWSPTNETEGAATAHVTGTGVLREWPNETVLGPCEGVIAFNYRSLRIDNGRAVVRQTQFTKGPFLVRANR